jgi:transposase
LAARTPAWREQVQVVAIESSVASRKALTEHLPNAAICVAAFHLVALANDMVTRVRQHLARQTHGRRGLVIDPAWANRRLLVRGANTLSEAG